MSSEWMKVMLDEIARKKAEAEQSRSEDQRRSEQRQCDEEQARQQEQQPALDARRDPTVPRG